MMEPQYTLINTQDPHYRVSNVMDDQFMLEDKKQSHPWKTAITGTGMIGVALALSWHLIHDHKTTVAFRTLAQQNILQGATFLPISAEEFLLHNGQIIHEIEGTYELPVGALKMMVLQEVGSRDKKTFLGMEPLSEQFLKAAINNIRSKLGDEGDMSRDGQHHLGLSFGLLNIKPGLINLAVIRNLRNPTLQQYLLDQYDDTNNHANITRVRESAETFSTGLELIASYMNLWKPYLLEYAKSQNFSTDETQRLFALLISTFPQEKENNDGENHYAWLMRDGFVTPGFMDDTLEP